MPRLTQKLPRKLQSFVSPTLVVLVVITAVLLWNTFLFRTYQVHGVSMEPTLKAGDVILVNKIGRSIATLGGSHFMPQRGQLVVFKNPLYAPAATDEAVAIKRIVGLPGERVVVRDGHITIFNNTQPEGFNPDAKINTIQQPTSGNVDRVVPEDELFVAGDNRIGSYSFDSRNGLSTVPLREIEGVVLWRVFPLTAWGGL